MRYGTTWRRRYNRLKRRQLLRLRLQNALREERASWYSWKWPFGWVFYHFRNDTEKAVFTALFCFLAAISAGLVLGEIFSWLFFAYLKWKGLPHAE